MSLNKELKSIFIGEVCLVVGYALSGVAILVMLMTGRVFTDAATFVGSELASSAMFTCSAVLQIVALIFIIKGCLAAGKEEPLFKSSMILFIISVVCALAESFLQGVGVFPVAIAECAKLIFGAIAVIQGAKGVAAVSEKAGSTEVAAESRGIIRPVIDLCVISVVMVLAAAVMEEVADVVMFSFIVNAATLLISAVIYDIYANVISKARKA